MTSPLMTRHAMAWLLLAQLVVMAPLLPLLPLWTALVWAIVGYWHWRIYRGDWHFPPRLVKFGLAIAALVGIYLEYRTALALEAQVSLLVSAFILKLLELKGQRDQWIVICIAYFIVACGFLFSQSMGDVLIAGLQLAILLLAQQSMFRDRTQLRSMLRVNWQLLYQSLPLMLLLFVVFPRFGPLWSVPLPSDSARTGMSDSMTPGDISRLSRSGELAFRVRFDKSTPPMPMLYWRGLVLENFDGRNWNRSDFSGVAATVDTTSLRGSSLAYEVTLEPGVHEWLLAMPVARVERQDIRQDGNYQILPRKILTGRLNYRAVSYPQQPLGQGAAWSLALNKRLPSGFNPRALELAGRWRQQFPDARQRLDAAISFFRTQPFTYTLEPPKLGRHSVDEFLFGTQQGFCEHFASSFVVLMRAAGVPARVVVGYQGGEPSPDGSYLLVHQSDAHAWAEVWLDGEGWQRVDPTGLVAPERIELGAGQALAGAPGFLADSPLSLRNFSGFGLATRLRFWMDNMEYAWARWVVNFDSDRQWDVLTNLLGEVSGRRLALTVLAAMALPIILSALLTLRLPEQQKRAPAVKQYLLCCQWLARKGVTRRAGEAPQAFAERVAGELPEWGDWIAEVTEQFYITQYQALREERTQAAFKRLRALRRRPYRSAAQRVSRKPA